jgi:DNA-directed RNA polymerase specialized sigma subunit
MKFIPLFSLMVVEIFPVETVIVGVKPTSIDERRKDAEILKKNGKTQKQIADIFQVSQSTISNDLKEKKKVKSL